MYPIRFRSGLALAAAALALAVAPAGAADNAPIRIHVTSALEGEKGFGRLLSSAGRGDVADTAREIERIMGGMRWVRLVSASEPEVVVMVDSRERVERRRTTDKEGRESIDHRYHATAIVEIDGRRSNVRAEHDFTEGRYSTRYDNEQFKKVAEKLVAQITGLILRDLDGLRPDRVDAGFAHTPKYKLLIKGDGLEVTSVEPGSPAEEAGLQVKDRIRRIGTEKGTDQMDVLVRTWWTENEGTPVDLEIERNKQRQTVQVRLAARSSWAGAAPSRPERARPRPAAAAAPSRPAAEPGRVDLKPGMTEHEVVRLLGPPREKVGFGAKTLWRYDGFSLTFEGGKVVDMK